METKFFLASKTLWVNAIAVAAALAGAFNVDLGLDPETQVKVVACILAVVNFALRFKTNNAIGK